MLDEITALILTYNEAPNIDRTLAAVAWARDIVVVDSFSDDETLEIAASFPQVRVFQRQFDSHRNQWEFGLRETCIKTPWVLALDADYVLTNDAQNELRTLRPDANVGGYRAKFAYCIHGKKLHSGIYPAVTVLPTGAKWTQVRPAVNLTGLPLASVYLVGALWEAFDHLPFVTRPLDRIQASPEPTTFDSTTLVPDWSL